MKRIAIVTGASSGIGCEFARQIAKMDDIDEIWAVARREERLTELQQAASDKIRPIALDLKLDESLEYIARMLEEERPDVEILVNNAGFGKFGNSIDLTREEIDDMVRLNALAPVLLTNRVLPYMKGGARILNMGSASAFQPLPGFNLYASSKVFVTHYTRALNVELKGRGISATAVCPGYVDTDFFDVARDTRNPDTVTNIRPMYPRDKVVSKALADSAAGRDISVLGLDANVKRLLAKLLPAPLVMSVWLRMRD
ncbi:MAG: SDR family NAD(P)-dependent oxidoreductase [Christensenellales bacterium]